MPTLNERIQTQQALVTKLKDDLVLATKALDEADEAGQDAALATIETLTGQLEAATKSLDALIRAEKALSERAQEAGHEDGNLDGGEGNNSPPVRKAALPGIIQNTKSNQTPIWLRMAVCEYLAFVERKSVREVMAERYPEARNKDLHAVYQVRKSAVPLATTFTTGWAAELVQDDVRGFLNLLAVVSAAAALALRGFNQNFDGFNTVTVPHRKPRAANNNMAGAFVGEGGAIPLGRLDLGAQSMSRYKMGVISTFSRELAERSTPSIEAIIRQAVLDDMALRLDQVVFSNMAAVPGIQPAGLLFGTTPITGATGGGPDALTADIKALVTELAGSGGTAGIIIYINDLDAVGINFMTNALGEFMFNTASGQLLTFSVVISESIPQGTIIGVVASNIATAFDPTDFNVSDVATVVEANADVTAPTHATGAAGAIGTADQVPQMGGIPVAGGTGAAMAGATARSLWQTYSIGIRAVQPVSWGMMRAGSAASVTGITWGA